jgi:hypothetical protein
MTIDNNEITNCKTVGMDLENTVNLIVSNNTIKGCGSEAIFIRGKNILVDNNTLDGNAFNVYQRPQLHFDLFPDTVTVTNNKILNTSGWMNSAMNISGIGKWIVANNVFGPSTAVGPNGAFPVLGIDPNMTDVAIYGNVGYNDILVAAGDLQHVIYNGKYIVDGPNGGGSDSNWTSGTTYINVQSPKMLTISGGQVSQITRNGIITTESTVTLNPLDSFSIFFTLPPTITVTPLFTLADIPEPETATINGVVTDSSGNPIDGATITATAYSTISGTNGSYQMSNLPLNIYSVTFSKSGYISQTLSINATAEGNYTLNVQLAPIAIPVAEIAGTILSATGPLADVRINAGSFSDTSKADGSYQLINLPFGSYSVNFTKTGYISQTVQVEANVVGTYTLNVTLVASPIPNVVQDNNTAVIVLLAIAAVLALS